MNPEPVAPSSSPVPVPTVATSTSTPTKDVLEPPVPGAPTRLYEPTTYVALFRDLDDARRFRDDPWFRNENAFQSLVAPVIAASSNPDDPFGVLFELVTTSDDVRQADEMVNKLAASYGGWLDGDPEPAPEPEPEPAPTATEAVARTSRW